VDVARVLVERGADIDKAMNDGGTSLIAASRVGHLEVVRMLLEQGADITRIWKGRTALQQAREENHPEIIHLLELAAQA
jgi:ankyrin repeat protein